jgi:hypothetical protein
MVSSFYKYTALSLQDSRIENAFYYIEFKIEHQTLRYQNKSIAVVQSHV